MSKAKPQMVIKFKISILFWIIWFYFYSLINSHGAEMGTYWNAPGIYFPVMVYPYVFGMALLVIIPFALYIVDDQFYRFLLIYFIMTVIMFTIYYIFPVVMLRREYSGTLLADKLMRWIVGMDDPANCFPSNHCAIATLGCIAILFKNVSKTFKIITIIVTVLVCLSTVLVGQHYWIDVPAGVILAAIVGFFGFKTIENRR